MSDYLWDRSGAVDPKVEALEQRLAPLAFDPQQHPLNLPRRRRRFSRPATIAAVALAASVIAVVGLGVLHSWRLSWPTDRAWSVSSGGSLEIGSPWRVDDAPASVEIARLGVLNAKPGTRLELNTTGPTHHRLTLSRGEIDVRVWAPPGRVGVHTPAGDVIDLGCIFSLAVDEAGAAHLTVHTGWVNLVNTHGNSFIPAGASASMTAGREPQVPVYDDAADTFKRAVRALESNAELVDSPSIRTLTQQARPRDAITLLLLSSIDGLDRDTRTALLETANQLQPAPAPDAVQRIVNGDAQVFWKWYDSLPLPPFKNWWVNWRDVFPR